MWAGRWGLIAAGGLLALAAQAQGPAVPKGAPEPRPLAPEIAPPKEPDPLSMERARLQRQLMQLLERLNDRPPAPAIPPAKAVPTGPLPRPKPDPGDDLKPVDALGKATNRFRGNDFEGALFAFRQIDLSVLPREDRAFAQYMTGVCLRKLNRRNEAATVFREVADAKDDEFVAECAAWQMSLIRAAQDLEAQLEQLRPRPKAR